MEIFPAIDLGNGQCVRLAQGDFARTTIYEADPVLQAQRFAEAGAEWLHVVDLDGARHGRSRQLDVIERMARSVPLRLQVGGGIRDETAVEALLDRGIERVVIGSLAVRDPAGIRGWLRRYGPIRIVAAFDVRHDDSGEPRILIEAWQQESGSSLWDVLDAYGNDGLKTVLCTDVGRDGMLAGPNLALYQAVQARRPELDLLASGGVRNVADLEALARLGTKGAIVGKAIYEGHIDLADAIPRVKHAR
ncbi:MAG: 1-(5-phosphoribosyl)-5-[(5-phosphoribosylamino)methylideneamino]imidazole-4-carboxamide isomerase [Rhizomicrobium sp.]